MDIQQLLQQLFSVKTVLLALGIGVIVYVVRLFVEKIPGIKKVKVVDKSGTHTTYPNKFSEWWHDVILYALPILIGIGIGGLAKQTFWPEFAPTRLGGIFYGAIAGWASGFVYRIAKKTLSGSDTDESTKQDTAPVTPKEDPQTVDLPKDAVSTTDTAKDVTPTDSDK